MSKSKKIIILVLSLIAVVAIGLTVLLVVLNLNEDGGSGKKHKHSFGEWLVEKEATCLEEGSRTRSCKCGETEQETIPKADHDFSVMQATLIDYVPCVQKVCSACAEPSDRVFEGGISDQTGEIALWNCDTNFSFDVLFDGEESALRQGLSLTGEESVSYQVQKKENGRWTVTSEAPYEEHESYTVSLSGGVTFADFEGDTLNFRTGGEERMEIVYNEDLLFLGAMEEASPGYYPYFVAKDEATDTYRVTLSKTGSLDESYVGKLICVGNCTNAEELSQLKGSEAMIGKITDVTKSGGKTVLTLGAPEVTELYETLNVSGSSLSGRVESTLDAETREALTVQILQNKDFATALTAAQMSAEDYAAERGYTIRPLSATSLKDSFEFEVDDEYVENGRNGVKVTMTVEPKFPIMKGNTELGSIELSFEIKLIYTFQFDAFCNLFDRDWGEKLDFYLKAIQYDSMEINMGLDVAMDYSYEAEMIYVVNPNSHVVHREDCRAIHAYRNQSSCRYTLRELKETFSDEEYLVEKKQCKICQPFTMDSSVFVINTNPSSKTVHCAGCIHVKSIAPEHAVSVSMYPRGYTPCEDCDPQDHQEDFAERMEKSLADSDWGKSFEQIRSLLGDLTKGEQSKHDVVGQQSGGKKVATFYFACFNIPIYVEPVFDLNLQATFDFRYFVSHSTTYVVDLNYNHGYYLEPNSYQNKDFEKTEYTLDLQGQLSAELGVGVDMLVCIDYVPEEWVKIYVSGEAGAYADLKGVVHADSEGDNYYAAYADLGFYAEAFCGFDVFVLQHDFDLLKKTKYSMVSGGDDMAYYAYVDYDQSLTLSQKQTALNDSMLNAVGFDLRNMKTVTQSLSLNGNEEYGVSYEFTDREGNPITYLSVDNGTLIVSKESPEEFDAVMIVKVNDKDIPARIEDYFHLSIGEEKAGTAIFLDELRIPITYQSAGVQPMLEYTLNADGQSYSVSACWDHAVTEQPDLVVSLLIPYEYKGLPVTEIAIGGFAEIGNCLKDVTILANIQKIGAGAFNGCTRLEHITLPNSVTEIHGNAFSLCINLNRIDLSENLKMVGEGAFDGCSKLTDANYPGSEEEWNQNVTVSKENEKLLAALKFNSETSLPDVDIDREPSEGLSYRSNLLGLYAVDGIGSCKDTEIVIPSTYSGSNVCAVFRNAFANCTNITTVILPDNGQFFQIDNGAFSGCTSLKTVVIPASVTSIGYGIFSGCTSLEKVLYLGTQEEWDSKVIYLGGNELLFDALIFEDGSRYKDPNSTPEMGNPSEGLAYKLNDDGKSYSVTGIGTCTDTDIVIPSTYKGLLVTVIGGNAFSDCTTLTSLTVPDSMRKIYSDFDGCTNFKKVIYMGTEAEWNSKVFSYADNEVFKNIYFQKCGQRQLTSDMQITKRNSFEGERAIVEYIQNGFQHYCLVDASDHIYYDSYSSFEWITIGNGSGWIKVLHLFPQDYWYTYTLVGADGAYITQEGKIFDFSFEDVLACGDGLSLVYKRVYLGSEKDYYAYGVVGSDGNWVCEEIKTTFMYTNFSVRYAGEGMFIFGQSTLSGTYNYIILNGHTGTMIGLQNVNDIGDDCFHNGELYVKGGYWYLPGKEENIKALPANSAIKTDCTYRDLSAGG